MITKAEPKAKNVRAYTAIKKNLPLMARELKVLDKGGTMTIDQPTAKALQKELSAVPAATLEIVDSALGGAIGDIRRICERLLVRLRKGSIEQDLSSVVAFLLRECQRRGLIPGPTVRASSKKAVRR